MLDLLLTWPTGQYLSGKTDMGWPDIHWLARDKGDGSHVYGTALTLIESAN
jgi:hypothetical protein